MTTVHVTITNLYTPRMTGTLTNGDVGAAEAELVALTPAGEEIARKQYAGKLVYADYQDQWTCPELDAHHPDSILLRWEVTSRGVVKGHAYVGKR